MTDPTYTDVPFHLGGAGRTASTDADDHVRDLILQVLLTSPGERVNRPDFGCGLKAMVFAPSGEAVAAATQVLVKGSLQKWLQDEIEVQDVVVEAVESTLTVTVVYRRRLDGELRAERFAVGT
ncbi:MAG TPA: GPW/gp25 family protein [Thermoleophilia bacterium]|nr:GPW/gp25 family protein [Thermoleophilia bacterium]